MSDALMTGRQTPLVSIVAAMSDNRVIGRGNRLPWHLPADLAHFKRLTLEKPIVMGRRTWESLPGLLPRRTHIVVTRDPSYRAEGCILVGSPQESIVAVGDAPEIMVIGGATLYRDMLPMARRMYLTRVAALLEGDVFFPDWDPSCWREVSREERHRDEHNHYDLTFLTLERVRVGDRRRSGDPTRPISAQPCPDPDPSAPSVNLRDCADWRDGRPLRQGAKKAFGERGTGQWSMISSALGLF
jgi:dihydrofolate reductase